mgnify:CR=1 FL=1
MKIAVIGSGISGLSSAYFLSKKYKVDLYEKDDHFGGHSFTYEIKEDDKIVPVDLGFIVFNEVTYPNLVNFFNELKVPYEKSDMSFSVSIKNSNVEYSGSGLGGIFANKLNLLNLKFLYMIREIISFYKTAPKLLESEIKEETLGNFLNKKKLSVDVGFIVFNHQTYPNLINFFKEIDIEIEKSDMSFSVSVEDSNYEYLSLIHI